jgi:superfamily II DNA/RNA helicase
MDRFERAVAVRRFNAGDARVLLATDAAGEGLNLQPRCRLVVNLELPWNPMRLEQRIGRVDRIGQRRTVHAVNLLASGSAETDMLARLARRLDHARSSVGAVDDVLGRRDESVVAACLGLDCGFRSTAAGSRPVGRKVPPASVQRLDLASAARDVAAHLERQRHLLLAAGLRRRTRSAEVDVERSAGTLVASVRRSRFPLTRGRTGLLAIFRVRSAARPGFADCEDLVPVFAEGPCPRVSRRRDMRARASDALAALVPAMAAAIPPRAAHGSDGSDRDRRLAARARTRRAVQRGLFDRRAERDADQAEAETARASDSATGQPPQPVLLLFVTS